MLKAYQAQIDAEKQLTDRMRKELVSGAEFFEIEIENLRKNILEIIVPEAQTGFEKLFETSIKKVNCLNNMILK